MEPQDFERSKLRIGQLLVIDIHKLPGQSRGIGSVKRWRNAAGELARLLPTAWRNLGLETTLKQVPLPRNPLLGGTEWRCNLFGLRHIQYRGAAIRGAPFVGAFPHALKMRQGR
jgi:hypothetical protein